MAFYSTEQRLPALSEVLPADILNSGRFSQFAPYSTGPQVKQEPYEALLKSASPTFYASSPAPSDWSAYSAPSPYSAGERTPSLSPSPSSGHSQLPPSVWVSQTAQQPPAAAGAYKELVWMPANMDIPGGSQQQAQAQRAGPQAAAAAAHFREYQRRGMIVECPPARAHGVAHLAPGRQDPDVYMGNDAAAFLSRGIPRIPENQRGKLVFFRYAQAPQKA